MTDQGQPGKPGEPGQRSTGAAGGAGGAGGQGGRGGRSEGDIAGGIGGAGGVGGAGEPGGGERGTYKRDGAISDRRRRAYWKQTGATPRWQLVLVYVLVVAVGAVGLTSIRDVAEKADTNAMVTNDALCALRLDLERRVAASEQFLREHPNGVAEIPAKTIRDGITNQQRTIKALSQLSCSAKP